MTLREAAIVTAYTGKLIGDIKTFHDYVEELMGRPVYPHEFRDVELAKEVTRRSKADFVAMSPVREDWPADKIMEREG